MGYLGSALVAAFLMATVSGCGERVEYDEQPQSGTSAHTDAGQAEADHAAAKTTTAATAGQFAGVVTETMDGGGYTYILVETDSDQRWVAGNKMSVAVGDRVTVAGAIQMRDFASDSLDRTFAEIWFAQTIRVGDAPAAAGGGDFDQGLGIGTEHVKVGAENIAELTVPDGGRAIAALYAQKEALAGQEVVVRGQVVKVTTAVMGKNWLHIQDGSGAGETADLTVTTATLAKVGDVVVVRGKLAVDRDFGYGYRYALLVEDAAVTVE